MDNTFTNIDEAFKNAFEHAEASYSPSEMQADWAQVAKQIPAPHVPVHKPIHQIGGSIGKILGLSGLGAATITAAVILYNIYVKDQTKTESQSAPQTVSPIISENIQQSKKDGKTDIDSQEKKSEKQSNNNLQESKTISNNPDKNLISYNVTNHFPQMIPGFSPFQLNTKPRRDPQTASNGIKSVPTIVLSKPKVTISAAIICVNQSITAQVMPGSSDISVDWGDGISEAINNGTTHVFSRSGKYAIKFSGINFKSDTLITVLDKPKAGFSVYQAEKLSSHFSNHSIKATKYNWLFDDGSAEDNSYNAVHTFPDTGRHFVRLVAMNQAGCSDTFSQLINVNLLSEPSVSSNVITPNGDNFNDDFYVTIQNETSYHLTIVDHAGQIVFDTHDKNLHWTGKNQFNGSECKGGAYFYSISYSYIQNTEPRTKMGSITLFR